MKKRRSREWFRYTTQCDPWGRSAERVGRTQSRVPERASPSSAIVPLSRPTFRRTRARSDWSPAFAQERSCCLPFFWVSRYYSSLCQLTKIDILLIVGEGTDQPG